MKQTARTLKIESSAVSTQRTVLSVALLSLIVVILIINGSGILS